MERSLTITIDEKTYKTMVSYKLKTGTALKYIIREALREKAEKLGKEK